MSVKITPRVRASSSYELQALMLAGAGIGCPPELVLRTDGPRASSSACCRPGAPVRWCFRSCHRPSGGSIQGELLSVPRDRESGAKPLLPRWAVLRSQSATKSTLAGPPYPERGKSNWWAPIRNRADGRAAQVFSSIRQPKCLVFRDFAATAERHFLLLRRTKRCCR